MSNGKNKVTAHEVISEDDDKLKAEKYNQYVSSITPKYNCFVNMFHAFWIGGFICVIGEGFVNLYKSIGYNEETAVLYEVVTLVFLSVLFTGLNIYSHIAKLGGAGTVVPITGFANSVACTAIEFKTEGQVFGIGCKIFTICGPVILYGIFGSWVLGILYWLGKLVGLV